MQINLDLSMADLRQRFPELTVATVMQCAGNRRAGMQVVRPTSGDPWAPGAIGNAAWTGVGLADVLCAAGAETDAGLLVAFEACDEIDMPDEGRFTYGVSIPMTKAMSPDVLLVHAMYGKVIASILARRDAAISCLQRRSQVSAQVSRRGRLTGLLNRDSRMVARLDVRVSGQPDLANRGLDMVTAAALRPGTVMPSSHP